MSRLRFRAGGAAAVAAGAVLALAGCGTASPPARVATVVDNAITGFKFQPNPQHVHAGDTVRWTNLELSQHTATADKEGLWDSPRLDRNGAFEYRFAAVGTFKYHCAVHPFMHGEVIVDPG